jgi:hypothetical protein
MAAWGTNAFGQLGDGTGTSRTTPVDLTALTKITQIAAGYFHSVALRSDATVWTWGWNQSGELGDGTTFGRTLPGEVPGLNSVTQITAGGSHTLAKLGPPELTAQATITGTRQVGATLSCGAVFLSATSVGYTWLRDTTAIAGAASATYLAAAADAGHQITCRVTATNNLGSSDSSATATIFAPAHFTGGTPPTGQVGVRYSPTFTATGAPTPKIALASGSLPPGLKLAANGTLSGTPSRAGTYKFTLSATNGIGTPAKAAQNITIR